MADIYQTDRNDVTVTEPRSVSPSSEPLKDTDNLQIVVYCIGAFGLVDNLFVICLLVKNRKELLTRSVYCFILHQSLVDFCTAAFLILTTEYQSLYPVSRGVSGEALCRLWLSKLFLWGPFMASTYNLCVMTLDRYFAVVKPLTYRKFTKKVKVLVGAAFVWTVAMGYNAGMKIPTSFVHGERCYRLQKWVSPTAHIAVGILTFFVEFIVPILLLISCYGHMVYTLRKSPLSEAQPSRSGPCSGAQMNTLKLPVSETSRKQMTGTTATAAPSSTTRLRARKNTIRTLIWLSFFFLFCWVWNQVYFLLVNLGFSLSLSGPFYDFTVVMAFMNCCVNPVVYWVKDKEFKMVTKKLFHCKTTNVVASVDISSSSFTHTS